MLYSDSSGIFVWLACSRAPRSCRLLVRLLASSKTTEATGGRPLRAAEGVALRGSTCAILLSAVGGLNRSIGFRLLEYREKLSLQRHGSMHDYDNIHIHALEMSSDK